MNKFFTFVLLFVMTIFIALPSMANSDCNCPCKCNCPCCEKVQPTTTGVTNAPCENKEHCKDCMKKENCCEKCPCCKEHKADK